MIELHDQYDNPQWINPYHIERMEITTVDEVIGRLFVKIHFVSGKDVVVKESLFEITGKMNEASVH